MREYSYYPGCSLKGSGRHYEESLLASFEALGMKLKELPDWNCCGATSYMAVDEHAAFAMVARNLAIAQAEGLPVVVPCAACYLNFKKTVHYMKEYPDIAERVCSAIEKAGFKYDCERGVEVLHPMEVLVNDVGLEELRAAVKRPLQGRAVPYYGCQLTRPFGEMDNPFFPTIMDKILETLGADVVSDYPLKTRCCGASLTGVMPEVGSNLCDILIIEARKRGGDYMVTGCPLCQLNLEAFHSKEAKDMPVLYITQVLGYALGIPEEKLGFNRLFVRPAKV